MSFTFQPLHIARDGNELELRGRVLTGAYFGPESVVVRSRSGEELATHIHSHAMEHPEGWPVLPEHRKTTLILRIPALAPNFEVSLLTGVGAIDSASERIDITHVLGEPEFWATQAELHFQSDDVEDPGFEWFGVTSDDAEVWYESRVDSHILAGRWPYVRVPLPGGRYVELEMAGGVEYQDRVWIGQLAGPERVLMGYHSGHFSLPAFRVAEVSSLADLTDFDPSNLLWLSTTYLQGEESIGALVERLVSRVPGVLSGKRAAMSRALLEKLIADDELRWTLDSGLGWINNSEYSQRNPRSDLSVLKPADFSYIRKFFSVRRLNITRRRAQDRR